MFQDLATANVILGPPGCGKTHTLIEIVKDALDRGISSESIGFVSFTKKAVTEAQTRAGAAFNLLPQEMPFFKTLHAMGYMMLGMQREDVMSRADWRAFAAELGTQINGPSEQFLEDGALLPTGMAAGDKYLRVIERAKMRCLTLEQEYNEGQHYGLDFSMMQRFNQLLDVYKAQLNKFTFVDMLDRFLDYGEVPRLRLLIVDEAQDLVPLQWLVVHKLAMNADEVYIAGDDDQAIHRWAGAQPSTFISLSRDPRILTQSYRLPRSVFHVARNLVNRIEDRVEKQYNPLDEEGEVRYYHSPRYVDFSSGSWSYLARTNKMVTDLAETMRDEGYMYSIKGNPSVNKDVAQAIRSWEHLCNGGAIDLRAVKSMYQLMPKQGSKATLRRGATKLLDAAAGADSFTLAQLGEHYGCLATPDTHAYDVLNLGLDDRLYIDALRRRGEVIWNEPRIKLSTIHAMKGGEDDNVALYLGWTWACSESEFPSDEHRVFYVGATRARHNLHIIEGCERYNYAL